MNPETGEVGNSLVDRTWYDDRSNVIKHQPGGSKQFTKHRYDSLGRQIKQFIGYNHLEPSYAEASTVENDIILEQIETDYDAAGNVIETRHRRRHHDASGTGELTTPTGAQPKARVSYVAHYHDALGREIATANYGTNGDVPLVRSATIPAPSDDVLVTRMVYNEAGQLATTIPPDARTASSTTP